MIALALCLPLVAPVDAPGKLAEGYAAACEKLNETLARKPGKVTEAELPHLLSGKASGQLEKLLAYEGKGDVAAALVLAGEAALSIDHLEDFGRVRARLLDVSTAQAQALGIAATRERFQIQGRDGVAEPLLERVADVFDAVLDGYDEVFGFAEWSKLPGKKLRLVLSFSKEKQGPPHFAPEHPYHSQVNFPVTDAQAFTSPTADGRFLFYGLCHELGHVIAMWGDRSNEEDHHAWAHYTGCAVVEHLAATKATPEGLKDARWRSLEIERERLAAVARTYDDRDGVLALLIDLHDALGPRAIGAAINHQDRLDRRLRINRVRYYTFDGLRKGLEETLASKRDRKRLKELLP